MTVRPEKPHYILLRCVEPGGPFVLNQSYYALKAHRAGPHETFFDVWVEGEIRVERDTRFTPLNRNNWWLFSIQQRERFHVPPPWSRVWNRPQNWPQNRRAA